MTTTDHPGFGQLYTQHADLIHRMVRSRLGDHHLAEDLTGETFTRALRAADTPRDPRAWLTTITLNLIRDHARTYRARFEAPVPEFPDTRSATPSPEQTVVDRETLQELQAAIGLLPARQREVIQTRFLLEMSVTAAANRLGCSEGTVKASQHHALKALRKAMTRRRPR